MKLTVLNLKDIIELGGGINIDVNNFTVSNLKDFAEKAQKPGATIIMRNTEKLTVLNFKDIAEKGAGKVIFEF